MWRGYKALVARSLVYKPKNVLLSVSCLDNSSKVIYRVISFDVRALAIEKVYTPLSRTVQAGTGPRFGVTELPRSIEMPMETDGCL